MRIVFSVIAAALLLVSRDAAAGTLDRVRETGVFKIGYRTDAPPFSYNSAIGEPAGYIVDLCREAAAAAKEELGLKDLKVEYVTVTAEDRFDAVTSGRIDLLCEATTVTLARRKLVDFSLMTFIDGASVMVRSDGPQSFKALAGHKIGVHAGTTTEDALRRTLADLKVEAEVVPVEDHADGVKRLGSGELAAYFADRAILTFLLLDEGSPKILRISK
ncbi:MAG: amino acid ABC transporter substrate-binding protein, partial [Dongiaceae bacterium]